MGVSQSKVRGAKFRARDFGAERFDDFERRLNMRTGLGEIVTSTRDAGDAVECGGFSLTITYKFHKRQRLAVILKRFLYFSQRIVDRADLVECSCFSSAIPYSLPDRKRLVEIVERFL